MLSNLKKWLLKPYPFPNSVKSKLLISFGIGNFVFLFLLIFKPFDLYLLEQPKFLDRLNQLFVEYDAKVIYARPVLNLENSIVVLDKYNSEERKNKLYKLLYAEAYRKLSDFTFDTENIENTEAINEMTTLIRL